MPARPIASAAELCYTGCESSETLWTLRGHLCYEPERPAPLAGALGILARPDEALAGPRGLPVRLAAATDLPIPPDSLAGLSIGAIRWNWNIPRPPLNL